MTTLAATMPAPLIARDWLFRSKRAVARMTAMNAAQQHLATRRLQARSLGMDDLVQEIDARLDVNSRRFRQLGAAHQGLMSRLYLPVGRIAV